jgi:tripartite-type tricarboxylate transporter receptor subunit TctC
MPPRSWMIACSIGSLLITSGLAAAQEYPTRPIRIVTGEPGGVPDIVARLIGQAFTAKLGKQVIVDNRGGASGVIAAQAVAKAPPDGHTLLFYAGALWIAPLLNGAQDDPLKDFVPVSLVASSPNIVVVHPSLPVKSVRELIMLAKARPRAISRLNCSTRWPVSRSCALDTKAADPRPTTSSRATCS